MKPPPSSLLTREATEETEQGVIFHGHPKVYQMAPCQHVQSHCDEGTCSGARNIELLGRLGVLVYPNFLVRSRCWRRMRCYSQVGSPPLDTERSNSLPSPQRYLGTKSLVIRTEPVFIPTMLPEKHCHHFHVATPHFFFFF